MATVSGGANVSPSFTQAVSILGASQNTPVTLALKSVLSPGTAADKCDLLYAGTIAFTASTPQTIDLKVLTDIAGGAVAFARVRFFAVKIDSVTDGAYLTVAAGASNGMTSIVGTGGFKVLASSATNPDGGWAVFSAPNTTGYAVGASTKTLDLTPSAHAFTAYLVIAGAST